MKKFKEIVLLGLVILLGIFLYFYKLNAIPSGFYIDEALPGYNAYSLLLTGKDEYGKVFPLALRFFGSYNPPLYTYLTIPFIALFGPTILAVRFLAAVAGVLSIIVIYLFVKNLQPKSNATALVSALLFAISPWQVLYSRVGYEVSLAFLFFSLGVLLTWKGINNAKKLVWGIIFLSLSTYTAYTQRFLVPMFLVGIFLVFKNRKNLKLAFIVALLTQIPNLYLATTPAFFPKTNLLPPQSTVLGFARDFLARYVAYFSPNNLFSLPDPDPQRSLPELSVFYPWMVIPFLAGIYSLFSQGSKTRRKVLIILLAIAPIPAAITRDPFSTHRALPFALPAILIISIGLDLIFSRVKRSWLLVLAIVPFSLVMLWRSYFVLLPNERARVWGWGYSQLAAEIAKRPDQKFVIDQSRIKPPYIQLAFHLKYPPEEFQKLRPDIKNVYYQNPKFDPDYQFANIETRSLVWKEDIYRKEIIVGDSLTVSPNQAKEHFLTKIFEIRDPTGEVVFVGYQTDPQTKCQADPTQQEKCSLQ